MARTAEPPGVEPRPLMQFVKAKGWFNARAAFKMMLGRETNPVLVGEDGMWMVEAWQAKQEQGGKKSNKKV
jgi:hypothetical protein